MDVSCFPLAKQPLAALAALATFPSTPPRGPCNLATPTIRGMQSFDVHPKLAPKRDRPYYTRRTN